METQEIQVRNNEEEWIAKYRAAISATIETPRAMTAREAFDSFCGLVAVNACKIADKVIGALPPASRAIVPQRIQPRMPHSTTQNR